MNNHHDNQYNRVERDRLETKQILATLFSSAFAFFSRNSDSESTASFHQSSRADGVIEKTTTTSTTMGDSMITSSIEYDYLIKFLALGDSGVGMNS